MAEFTVKTSRHCEIIDITEDVNRVLPQSIPCGMCHIYCPHTTAGITINENADPDVKADLLRELDRVVPWEDGYRHAEGNSAAHLKASMLGASETVVIYAGRLALGTWQGVYLAEFDGSRKRTVYVKLLAG